MSEQDIENEIQRLERAREAKVRYLQILEKQKAEKSDPICANCEQLIPSSEKSFKYAQHSYHAEHFVCFHCKEKLGKNFFGHDGLPYCEKDYLELFEDKCANCSKALTAESVEVGDAKYHPDCFKCSVCDQLIEGQFSSKEGVLKCMNCILPTCSICNQKIDSEYLEVNDKPCHKACYEK